MRPFKPAALVTRNESQERASARARGEAAVTPTDRLPARRPPALKGHARASKLWKRLLRLYAQTDGVIVTAFDEELLLKYCLADEQLFELHTLRAQIKELWEKHVAALQRIQPDGENLKDYFNALAQANALLQRFQGMDARMDGKAKLLHQLEQSLYLSPRSRAGVPPPEKEPEEPRSAIDILLDDEPYPMPPRR